MNIAQIHHYYYSTGSEPTFSDTFGDDIVVWIDPSNPYTMFKESGLTGIGLTEANTNNDTVGQLYDSGPNVLMLYALSDAGRPLLKSDSTINSYLEFDGSAKVMRFSPSSRLFAGFLSGFTSGAGIQPVFTCAFKIKKAADGVAMVIMDNNDGSATASGFSVQINSSNRIELRFNSINTPFPVSSIAHTTTATITTSDGWCSVRFEANQQGASTGKIVISKENGTEVTETFSVNGGAGSATVSPELTIGRRATTADRFFNGGLTQFLVINRLMTDSEWTLYKAYNPQRVTREFLTLESRYDFNDTARGWADAAKTTPITTSTAIRAWENYVRQNFRSQNANSPNFKDLTTSSTLNTWPIKRADGAEWDGSDDNLDFNEKMAGMGGRKTIFLYAKNDDQTNGSRFVNDSANTYIVFTGNNYSGNADRNGVPYCAVHLAGVSDDLAIDLENASDQYNVIALVISRSSITLYNGLGETDSRTLTSGYIISDMGLVTVSQWWLDGTVKLFEQYYGAMTQAQVLARIAEIKALP
jgi:hypothetical protein